MAESPPVAEPLWSLKAFAVQEVPVVKRTEWPKSRVDGFILARLEKEGLGPNEEAEPLTLLRRVYFDLIGLPPPQKNDRRFAQGRKRPEKGGNARKTGLWCSLGLLWRVCAGSGLKLAL